MKMDWGTMMTALHPPRAQEPEVGTVVNVDSMLAQAQACSRTHRVRDKYADARRALEALLAEVDRLCQDEDTAGTYCLELAADRVRGLRPLPPAPQKESPA